VRSPRHRRQRRGWTVALLLADALGAVCAGELALLVGSGSWPTLAIWRANGLTLALLFGAWLLCARRHPGYVPRPERALITVASQSLTAVATGSVATIVALYVLAPGVLADRSVILAASAVMVALMALFRHLAAQVSPSAAFAERYLLLGNGERARVMLEELGDGRHPYTEIVALVPFEATEPPASRVPVLSVGASAAEYLAREEVTDVVVCQPQPLPDAAARWIAQCEAAGIEVHSLEAAYEHFTRRVPLFHVGDDWIASLDASAQTLYAARLKRMLDLLAAAVGLLLTGPLVLILALLVKLTSKGPAFFRQERMGFHGRPFTFAKLRTMVEDAEAECGPIWAARDDPRVTPIGRFLRRSRLDELPQLWNVLIGEMSLVGPRPEREHFVTRFREEIPHYEKRLLVLPGITGWAQVHQGYDASTDDVIEKLRYDLYYVNHLCLKLDLLVLLKTISVVLRGRGAH
jgi:exopolysaccharide biosynthesis polyprenyl glycosylphosphotransferase